MDLIFIKLSLPSLPPLFPSFHSIAIQVKNMKVFCSVGFYDENQELKNIFCITGTVAYSEHLRSNVL